MVRSLAPNHDAISGADIDDQFLKLFGCWRMDPEVADEAFQMRAKELLQRPSRQVMRICAGCGEYVIRRDDSNPGHLGIG